MKAYSIDLREKIISIYEAGSTSIRKVAERFKVNKSTVQDLVKRKPEKAALEPSVATGGKASRLSGYEQQIEAMVAEHPDYTCEYWEEKTGVGLSESAMCRFLQQQKLTLKKQSEAVK